MEDNEYHTSTNIKTPEPTAAWIPELGLSMQDKAEIQNGQPVRHAVAKAVVAILREQFQDTQDMLIRCVGARVMPVVRPTIHLHMDTGHAFVTAFDGECLVMADSGHLLIDHTSSAFRQIEECYRVLLKDPLKHIQFLNVQKQAAGDCSCVMHSAANMVELLTPGGNPECKYVKKLLRPHFIQCLENKEFTRFPKHKRPSPKKRKHT